MMKDILQKLAAIETSTPEQLSESAVAEANFDSKKISTGTVYTRKYDPDTGETVGTQRTAEPEKKKGRGRPKKDAGNDGEVMKPDWSAFGVKPVKLSKDPNARKIKGRDTVDESVMRRAMDVIESALVLEKEMTDAQMAKREEIVKAMKDDMDGFKKRYGDRAEAVMYATATKQAMKEGDYSYKPSGEEIMGKRPEDETTGDKIKKFVKKVANKIAPDDETLMRDLEKKALGEDKVDEDEVEEGNKFSGELAKAKEEGKDEFEFDGKKYKVNESVELAECGDPMMPAGEVTISGTPDALATMLKMAGMSAPAMTPMEEGKQDRIQQARDLIDRACGLDACSPEELGDHHIDMIAQETGLKRGHVKSIANHMDDDKQEVEEEYANEPDEEIQDLEAVIPSGDDLHKAKGAYPATAGGDNPMAIDEEMWAAYQALKSELQ